MLELTNIEKSFGNQTVFSINSLVLEDGIYWLKGINGSGKSTFLNMLAGLIPFSGSVVLGRKYSIRRQGFEYRARVNHSDAEPVYPSFLSGREILDLVLHLKKGTSAQVRTIREALSIEDYLDNPTGCYSSGMLKKLSLLMAFTGQARWILLDEPFTTLDQASQSALQNLIEAYHGKGVSFLITSHHDIEPGSVSLNGCYLLHDKKINAIGYEQQGD